MNVDNLSRLVLRKEVLFYHQVLEKSLDHLLQALYALNCTYFPSWKRKEEYIQRLGKNLKTVMRGFWELLKWRHLQI